MNTTTVTTTTPASFVRAVVPIVVGFGVALLTKIGVTNPQYVAAIGAAAGALYAIVVRAIETKYPKVGILLGAKTTTAPDPLAAVTAQVDAAVAQIKSDAIKYATAYATKEVAALQAAVIGAPVVPTPPPSPVVAPAAPAATPTTPVS